jgi:ADP-ribose pyrophosphatase YjhB (NUDIX family)
VKALRYFGPMAEIVVVYARQPAPESWDAAVFLAGPTPRSPGVASWRPEAVALLREAWPRMAVDGQRLVVFSPEDPAAARARSGAECAVKRPEPGGKGGGTHGTWEAQVAWEDRELRRADVIVFWVPRDLATLPGFTTNVEYGRWHDSGKVVLGTPPDAPGIRYLRHYAPGPVADTLPDTIAAALRHIAAPARRTGAERDVPLHLWHRPEFQAWHADLRAAGNELRAARPATSNHPPVWTLPVAVWVRAEDRVKSNDVVVLRPDAVAVVLHRPAATVFDTEVVLVREHRSAARTPDGYVRELPGGSGPGTPLEQAVAEVHEETGLDLAAGRLRGHGSRPAVSGLATHRVHLFSAELTAAELDRVRANAGVPHGAAEASERTFVEVVTYRQLLDGDAVDWVTMGQVAAVLDGR